MGRWGKRRGRDLLAHLIPVGIDYRFDLSVPAFCEAVQCTHPPVFIGSRGADDSRGLAVKIRLKHARNDVDVFGLFDADDLVAALYRIAEGDASRVRGKVCIAGIGADEGDVGETPVGRQLKSLDSATVDERLDESKVGVDGQVIKNDSADASRWATASDRCAPCFEVLLMESGLFLNA